MIIFGLCDVNFVQDLFLMPLSPIFLGGSMCFKYFFPMPLSSDLSVLILSRIAFHTTIYGFFGVYFVQGNAF